MPKVRLGVALAYTRRHDREGFIGRQEFARIFSRRGDMASDALFGEMLAPLKAISSNADDDAKVKQGGRLRLT
jgi:hypothetical protein